ncbi:MAG TPA: TIGR04282 family arsenosugar biosynthesis glycosyltransferase [Micromonosporaceae bacterium]|jgi:hypothetical protein
MSRSIRSQLLVIAKVPVPGRVKTRLCPPCTPDQAASIAAAALADTLTVAAEFPAVRHTLVLAGGSDAEPAGFAAPVGWRVLAQRGGELGERLAYAFRDTALPGVPSLLIGMDTPQLTGALLAEVATGLADADAVLAPALDGGWWALALNDPGHAHVLTAVATSTSATGELTAAALRALGLRVAYGPVLRDVDVAVDARAVALACPDTRFATAVRRHLPALESV